MMRCALLVTYVAPCSECCITSPTTHEEIPIIMTLLVNSSNTTWIRWSVLRICCAMALE